MTFPSEFMLVAAMNPVPDGKTPAESRCSPREIQNYLGRISGPLLDRIDLHVEVPPVKFGEITGERPCETSPEVRKRVLAARGIQQNRFKDKPKITCNARMGTRGLKRYCFLNEQALDGWVAGCGMNCNWRSSGVSTCPAVKPKSRGIKCWSC
jgi:magnesium chelatase family protein